MKQKFIIPILVGVIGFLLVVGESTLNFQNIGWLSKGDALFNYVGWEIFRQSPWTSPIGLNPNYGLEFSSSIVYSDSVPILAILFKIFSKFLGEPFQYFGLWLLICFVLQAFFGYKLAELITNNARAQLSISIMFLFAPVMLFRANVHLALAGQFVILWALYLNLNKTNKVLPWASLMVVVLGVHFYLFVMVFALWIASVLDRAFSSSNIIIRKSIFDVIFISLLIIISAWQYGYFSIALGEAAAIGYGGDRINLFAFLNPFNWSLLCKYNLYEPPTIEGFAYMGAGAIFASLLGLYGLFQGNLKDRLIKKSFHHKFMLLSLILLSVIAITHNIDIGNTHFELPISSWLYGLLSSVRSSGRMIWPLEYFLIFTSLWLIVNGYGKRAILIIFILSTLQVVDTSKGWRNVYSFFVKLNSQHIPHHLTDTFWDEVPKIYSVIRIISPYWGNWNTVGVYAAHNKMATNSVYLARVDKHKLEKSIEKTDYELANGMLDPHTIYLFQAWSSDINLVVPKFDPSKDVFARIDGLNILAPNYKLCKECKSIDSKFEITSIIPSISIEKEIFFSSGEEGGKFLIDGWNHSESWGVWSSGPASLMAIPMGANQPSKLRINFRGMVGPKHQFTDIRVLINGQEQKVIRIKKQMDNSFDLDIPKSMRKDKFIKVKFEYLNPISPKDAGFGNQDDRVLTLGIESMKVIK